MIRVRQIEVEIDKDNLEELKRKCAKKVNCKVEEIQTIKIHKKNIDARKKPMIFYCYEIDIEVQNETKILQKSNSNDILKTPNETYHFPESGTETFQKTITIVGAGPSGLFCAYMLATNGYPVTVIERGEKIEDRVKTVENFWKTGILNPESNVQFGEGGAGTFSDGKLNTLVKDPFYRHKKVLEIFVECGAPKEILNLSKPHIGTDLLRNVIIEMRNKILENGGVFKYNTCLTDIEIENQKIKKIEVNRQEQLETDLLVLALGHSARDTFQMLYEKKLEITSKPFAMGIRIQHPQKMINESQYGSVELPPASYKLTYKASNGHGVYTFCMCPGGFVVNASSEKNRLAINGMSNHKRDTENANSAIIVTVSSKDFGDHPLDGIFFQQKLEEKTYQLGNGKIPVQLYRDFKKNQISKNFESINPIFKGDYTFTNIQEILPSFMTEALIEGIEAMGQKIKGFNRDDAILAAIESRTSSPIRIFRDENCISNIAGIYPIGEGAGYAGGIVSAAMDGIKIAEEIAKKYKKRV